MLRAINAIQGIGLLDLPAGAPAVLLDRSLVVRAENAVGKSTLAAVLHSLAAGLPDAIVSRRTLGSKMPQVVEITLDDGCLATFSHGVWSESEPRVWVYDREFIESNVYAHGEVGADQRRGLMEFALGTDGTALLRAVDAQTKEAYSLTSKVSSCRRELEAACRVHEVELDDLLEFLDAGTSPIADMLEDVCAATLRELPLFESLYLPHVDLDGALAVMDAAGSIGDAWARDIVEAVERLGDGGWGWLRHGWMHAQGDRCPYCAQALTGNHLADAYAAAFEASDEVCRRAEDVRQDAERALSDLNLDDVSATLARNHVTAVTWAGYGVDEVLEDPVDANGTCRYLRDALCSALGAVADDPRDLKEDARRLGVAVDRYRQLEDEVIEYNAVVGELNGAIEAAYASAEARGNGSSPGSAHDVALCRASRQLEHQVRELREAEADKERAVEEKERLRAELNRLATGMMAAYGPAVGDRLADLGAEFELKAIGADHTGGYSKVAPSIGLRECRVGLKSSQYSPSFRNALSQSDKDVLALAFFLGRIDMLPDDAVAEMTLVFDDPVVGFDSRRRRAAGAAMLEAVERGAQVIVLTHQSEFADVLLAAGFAQSLCIRRDGDRSVIESDRRGAP